MLKNLILVTFFFSFSYFDLFSQSHENKLAPLFSENTSSTDYKNSGDPEIPIINTQKLIIGFGNSDIKEFYDALDFLRSFPELSILETCETHRIIQIIKPNDFHKDEMEFLNFLSDQLDGLSLQYKKSTNILNKECYDETYKP